MSLTIFNLVLDLNSLLIGIGITLSIIFLIKLFFRRNKPEFQEMKSLIEDTHKNLKEANENQRKLYNSFLKIEEKMV